jgi:hypothetical protein
VVQVEMVHLLVVLFVQQVVLEIWVVLAQEVLL